MNLPKRSLWVLQQLADDGRARLNLDRFDVNGCLTRIGKKAEGLSREKTINPLIFYGLVKQMKSATTVAGRRFGTRLYTISPAGLRALKKNRPDKQDGSQTTSKDKES